MCRPSKAVFAGAITRTGQSAPSGLRVSDTTLDCSPRLFAERTQSDRRPRGCFGRTNPIGLELGDGGVVKPSSEAELELARVRQVKTALVERIVALSGFEVPKHFSSDLAVGRWINAMLDLRQGPSRAAPPAGPTRAFEPWTATSAGGLPASFKGSRHRRRSRTSAGLG